MPGSKHIFPGCPETRNVGHNVLTAYDRGWPKLRNADCDQRTEADRGEAVRRVRHNVGVSVLSEMKANREAPRTGKHPLVRRQRHGWYLLGLGNCEVIITAQ